MGDRAQVKISDVYLYTHWGATDLISTVKASLKRGWSRRDDDEYLARIVFCDMIGDDYNGLTGYGIGTQEHGDIGLLIDLDCDNQKVTITEKYPDKKQEMTFEEFIKF